MLESGKDDFDMEIRSTDMSVEMQAYAIECVKRALQSSDIEKDIAENIKDNFDQTYSPIWHCIVGSSYGSKVTPEIGHHIHFIYKTESILLFKCGNNPQFERSGGDRALVPYVPRSVSSSSEDSVLKSSEQRESEGAEDRINYSVAPHKTRSDDSIHYSDLSDVSDFDFDDYIALSEDSMGVE